MNFNPVSHILPIYYMHVGRYTPNQPMPIGAVTAARDRSAKKGLSLRAMAVLFTHVVQLPISPPVRLFNSAYSAPPRQRGLPASFALITYSNCNGGQYLGTILGCPSQPINIPNERLLWYTAKPIDCQEMEFNERFAILSFTGRGTYSSSNNTTVITDRLW